MNNSFVLENSEEIIEALNQYYYQCGDVHDYFKCLHWINQYVTDDNVTNEINFTLDFLEEDEITQLCYDENMSHEVMEALEDYYTYLDGLDVQPLINALNELNRYCESDIFDNEIDQLCREHNLCPIDYGEMVYKNPCGDSFNPYENGFMECQKCGYVID